MWYLKACKVCGGDCVDSDYDPGYAECFACARVYKVIRMKRKETTKEEVRDDSKN